MDRARPLLARAGAREGLSFPASLAAASLLAGLALHGCATGSPRAPERVNRFGRPLAAATPVPAWVDHPPESTRERYVAVGFSKPTFWPQDALTNAAEDARGKLALALSSHVESTGRAAEASPGRGGARTQLDITKEATDLVVQNSRIEATWTDEAASRDEAGAVWAMAVIDLRPSGSGRAVDETNLKNGNKMPGWLDRLPVAASRIYAAGYSGPTFSAGDALQYAGDAAVQNLAASLRSHVQAYQLLIETKTGMSIDEFAHSDDPDAAFLELVRKSARVEQVWVDEEGGRPGDPPGAVWALAGIDIGSEKGGYQKQENDALGPALDAHGNVPGGVSDAPSGPTLQQQVAARAQQANAAAQAKAQETKAEVGSHNAQVQQAVREEQRDYREQTHPPPPVEPSSPAPAAAPGSAQTPAPALVPLNGGGTK